MKRNPMLLIIACLILLTAGLLPPAPAQAAHGVPLALFDPTSTGWLTARNMTSAAHQDFFDSSAAKGYMLLDAERHVIKGQLRVSSVWQSNADGRGWASRSDLTSQEFGDYWEQYRKDGYRLIDQEAYSVAGQLQYAGIWVENKEKLEWASLRDLTDEAFATNFDAYRRDGFILTDTEAYTTPAGGLRYSQIWVKNTAGLGWVALRNLNDDQYAANFAKYRDEGYRVHDLESYLFNGTQYYAAIWIKNTNGRGWFAYRDMTSQAYGNRWLELRDAGYRVTDFEIYDTTAGLRYAAVWRQNNDRPNWSQKDAVTRLIEQHMNANGVAGMSVTIGVEGQLAYMRGFGQANIALSRNFHSGTIARVASGCKAVAGTLALRLDQTTSFDIDNPTRQYAPSLPSFHSHTVAQLLSNRGGVRHYNAGADVTKNVNIQYNSALAASALFQNDPLLNLPGAAYSYSTHGYTLAGAALEGFTGQSIAQILNQRLSQPFNLLTLQAEDRSVPNAQRAALYKGTTNGPEAVIPDNVSWKVLGGGCEVSGYDYARFGIKLVNGTILNPTNLNRLWTSPNSGQSNYALGWSTGTDQGTRVVTKNGAQTGASSYLRVYPDKEIVIAILSNQRGHSTTQLGRDIGTLLLNAGVGTAALTDFASPAQDVAPIPPSTDSELLEPQSEQGEPFFDQEIPSVPAPTATDDSTEPVTDPFAEGNGSAKVYLPLTVR